MAPPGAAGEAARGPGLRRGRDAALALSRARRSSKECWCCCFPYFTRTPAELKLGDATAAGPARALLPSAAALVFRILPVPVLLLPPG